MQEKNVSMEDAFQVWWFMFWRTLLVLIGANVIINVIKFAGINLGSLGTMISLVISIITNVYFIKMAINRNYKNFRLSLLINNNQQ